jgi:hypothetical protein
MHHRRVIGEFLIRQVAVALDFLLSQTTDSSVLAPITDRSGAQRCGNRAGA